MNPNRLRVGKHIFGAKGQAIIEYAVLIAVIIASLLAMSVYLKRGVSGKLRDLSDQIGVQYDPYQTSGGYSVTLRSTAKTTTFTTEEQDGPVITATKKTQISVTNSQDSENRRIDETVSKGTSLF